MPSQAARMLATAALATVALALAGCAGDEPQTADTPAGASASTTTSAPAAASTTEPFGPACSGLPASGPGSAAEMADDPVATAAAQNPALSTLVSAVTAAGLVDTLNNAPSVTVFAPTNDAFAKIPQDTLNQILADRQALTNILTYHVVEQRRTSAELDDTLPTLQGGTITVAGGGDAYTVNDARVLCGNVQTRNATVYLIDTVLIPQS
jgi:uncharacterized surface protein with fasciclin (FAS1) repeats